MVEIAFDETVAEAQAGAVANWDALNRHRNAWIYPGAARMYLPSDFERKTVFDIRDYGCIADGPIPTNAFGTPSTAGATINTTGLVAAASAAKGQILFIPPSATGSYVINGKIPLYADTHVLFGGPGARIVLADGSVLSGRESTSVDVGMFELATDHERRVVINGGGKIHGTGTRQLGHSSGTTWTLAALSPSVTTSASSLAFKWTETIAAGLFPTPPFPIRFVSASAALPAVSTCEVCIVESLDIPNKTGVLRAGTRGYRETTAIIHAAAEPIKVEYAEFFLDMSTNSETNATGQLEEHIISDLWLMHASGNGIHLMGLGADGVGRMHHCHVANIFGHNIDGNLARLQSSDGTCSAVVSSLAGRQAVCIPGANWHGPDNKGFNSGRICTELGIALDILGSRVTGVFMEGQDNNLATARVSGPDNELVLIGDSNGRVTGQDGTTLILDGQTANCKNNTITVKSFTSRNNADATTNRQAYSVSIVNDGSNGVDDNTVKMNNRRLTKGDISGDPIGNRIFGDGQHGQQSVASAASITPHPDLGETILITLAVNTVINIPTNKSLDPTITLGGGVAGFGPCYRDQVIEMIFTDTAGAHTVDVSAFIIKDAAWKDAAAGSRSIFRAKCISADGLTWLQIP